MNWKIVLIVVFITIVGVSLAQSLTEFYLWTKFPDATSDRVSRIIAVHGTGRDCSSKAINISAPEKKEIEACFSKASEQRVILQDKLPGKESITRIYRCDGDGFSSEIIFTFYSTMDVYLCHYKLADNWEKIPKYEIGDIAGYSPNPSLLASLLITIFR